MYTKKNIENGSKIFVLKYVSSSTFCYLRTIVTIRKNQRLKIIFDIIFNLKRDLFKHCTCELWPVSLSLVATLTLCTLTCKFRQFLSFCNVLVVQLHSFRIFIIVLCFPKIINTTHCYMYHQTKHFFNFKPYPLLLISSCVKKQAWPRPFFFGLSHHRLVLNRRFPLCFFPLNREVSCHLFAPPRR